MSKKKGVFEWRKGKEKLERMDRHECFMPYCNPVWTELEGYLSVIIFLCCGLHSATIYRHEIKVIELGALHILGSWVNE